MSAFSLFGSLRIRGRLILGFAAVCAVLAAAVGYTVFTVGGVGQTVDRMVALRTPAALEITTMVGDLYSTLATLRGYLLTGNAQNKSDRAASWRDLAASIARFEKIMDRITDPEDKRRWTEAKAIFAEFRVAQDKVEAIAFTPDAYPATKLLETEAVPRVQTMFSEITKMINEEADLEATPERKLLLKVMADFRGNLTAGAAQIRMFLLTGDKAEKERFAGPQANFEKAFAALDAQKVLLNAKQRAAFDLIAKAHAAYVPIPDKIFAMRESAQWNMPLNLLVTEAAPRAVKLLDLLDGQRVADGTRSGGIKTSQTGLLTQEADEVQGGMSLLALVEWLLLAGGLAVSAAIAFITARAIATPIRGMTQSMANLANGDTSVVVPGIGRRDEIGEMASAVQVFKDNMTETERLRAEQAEAEQRMAAQRKTDMRKLAADFQAAVGDIINTVSSASTELEAAAATLTKTADTTQQLSGAAMATSERASANVNSVASASEQLAGSVNEIARQVLESSRIAGEAVKQAERTDVRIAELSQAAGRIGDVVKLITAIAEQTNLLALNATIEAARAGEAGRGFAVVAQEVKALAAQTAKATDEIGTQIAGMQAATQESVTAIKEIGGTINRVSEITSTIAATAEQQGAATQEISRNIQQAAKGTAQVAANITDVSRSTSETGSASSQVLASAQSLSQESNHLKVEVEKFLTSVRVA